MNILILCNKSPWPPKEGGPMAMNMMVEGLLHEGHRVKILAVNSFKYAIQPDSIPLEYVEKSGIELIDVDLRVKVFPALLNLFTGNSYHVERFISARFNERLKEVLLSGSFDIIQLETLFVTPYIKTIRQHSHAPIILRSHNIENRIWSRIAKTEYNPVKRWYLRHLAKTLERYENQVINTVDGIIAITETDADYFRQLNAPPLISIPYGINLRLFPKTEKAGEPLSLYSIGAMNWIPNAEGIRWFLRDVWPTIHDTFPEVTYHLAGREMPPWMKELQIPGVRVAGEVDNARVFSLQHGIMIVPLFSGSGIRVKIIEGMANSRAIVSTRVGAEGISCSPGNNILIANTACDFIETLSLCIQDSNLRQRLGSGGRKLVETTYNESILIQKLITFYHQFTG